MHNAFIWGTFGSFALLVARFGTLSYLAAKEEVVAADVVPAKACFASIADGYVLVVFAFFVWLLFFYYKLPVAEIYEFVFGKTRFGFAVALAAIVLCVPVAVSMTPVYDGGSGALGGLGAWIDSSVLIVAAGWCGAYALYMTTS